MTKTPLSIVGTPWGSDILVTPPTTGSLAPFTLDLATPSLITVCAQRESDLGSSPDPDLAQRIGRALEMSGFRVARTEEVTGKLSGHSLSLTPGFAPPAFALVAERNLMLDKTRSTAFRKRAYLFLLLAVVFSVVALWLAFTVVTISPNVIVLVILPAGVLFGVALVYLTSVDYWSEFIAINYGTTQPDAKNASGVGVVAGRRIIRGWTGVARSENWQSKTGHGRAIRQAFSAPSLEDTLQQVLARIGEPASDAPLA